MTYLIGSSRLGQFLQSDRVLKPLDQDMNLVTIGSSNPLVKSDKLDPNWEARVNQIDNKKYTIFISSIHTQLHPATNYAMIKRAEEKHMLNMFSRCLILRSENIIGLPLKNNKFEIMRHIRERTPDFLFHDIYKNFLPAKMLSEIIQKLYKQRIEGILEVGSMYPVSPRELYDFVHSSEDSLELSHEQINRRINSVRHRLLLNYVTENDIKITRKHLL